jgi:hypothetical protein
MVDSSGAAQDTSPIDAGYAALLGGEWDRARACFKTALAEEEIPEALEGLGRAAWWLGDGPVTFRARERAYQLYRRREMIEARRASPSSWHMTTFLLEASAPSPMAGLDAPIAY